MTPGVWLGLGLGLGEVELVDGLGLWDGLDGEEDVLWDGLGDPDELLELLLPEGEGVGVWVESARSSLTAENAATVPDVHGEWADVADAAAATGAASAGAARAGAGAEPGKSKEPDHMNMPLVTKTTARPASAIFTGTAALRCLTRQQPVPPP